MAFSLISTNQKQKFSWLLVSQGGLPLLLLTSAIGYYMAVVSRSLWMGCDSAFSMKYKEEQPGNSCTSLIMENFLSLHETMVIF